MVVGISNQAGVRRTFEDTFAEILKANGVEAVPSHTVVPDDGQMAEDKLRSAVQQSGAGAVLITRMVEKQTETALFVAEPPEPVWTGTARTMESKDIRAATEGFAKPVIAAMKKEGLI